METLVTDRPTLSYSLTRTSGSRWRMTQILGPVQSPNLGIKGVDILPYYFGNPSNLLDRIHSVNRGPDRISYTSHVSCS